MSFDYNTYKYINSNIIEFNECILLEDLQCLGFSEGEIFQRIQIIKHLKVISFYDVVGLQELKGKPKLKEINRGIFDFETFDALYGHFFNNLYSLVKDTRPWYIINEEPMDFTVTPCI